MTPEPISAAEAAARLRGLADRVGRLKPMSSDPEKFHVDKSEIESELVKLARRLDPRPAAERRPPDSRFTPGEIEVGGRRVTASVRRGRARPAADEAALKAFR
jgi:hypothetical protein